MRPIPSQAIDLIKQFEGCKLKAYRCPANVLTIGYGDTENVTEGMTITMEEAQSRLERQITRFAIKVIQLTKVPLNDAQFASLIDFVYNLGAGAYQRSTLRAKLNRGDYCHVAEEFVKYCKAGGKILKGLLRRRLAERDLFLSN